MTGCRGLPKRWEAVSDRVLKHSLVTATVAMQDEAPGRRPIVFCMKCGRWAQHRLVGLAEPCRQVADRYGSEVLRCIDKGKHPDTHQTEVRVEAGGKIGGRQLTVLVEGSADLGASQLGGKLTGPYPRREPGVSQPSTRGAAGARSASPRVGRGFGCRQEAKCKGRPASAILPCLEAVRLRILARQ